jgi:hypothetical protein
MTNRKTILQQYVTNEPSRKKLKIFKYEKIESVLLEWFRQKRAYQFKVQCEDRRLKK